MRCDAMQSAAFHSFPTPKCQTKKSLTTFEHLFFPIDVIVLCRMLVFQWHFLSFSFFVSLSWINLNFVLFLLVLICHRFHDDCTETSKKDRKREREWWRAWVRVQLKRKIKSIAAILHYRLWKLDEFTLHTHTLCIQLCIVHKWICEMYVCM